MLHTIKLFSDCLRLSCLLPTAEKACRKMLGSCLVLRNENSKKHVIQKYITYHVFSRRVHRFALRSRKSCGQERFPADWPQQNVVDQKVMTSIRAIVFELSQKAIVFD